MQETNEEKKEKKDEKKVKNTIMWILTAIIAFISIIALVAIIEGIRIDSMGSIDKPIIYLYPTEDTQVLVKLGNSDKITVSYPKYTTGWNVLAKKDGTLIEEKSNKNLYALYYESESVEDFKLEKEGFIVKGEEVARFLEEKLTVLGLNEKEQEEFIIYWLPKLETNKYNYIRFATQEEINKNMPLDIQPKPDTTIRILMTYKGLNKPIEVQEQKLTSVERQGFVSVEWGGTEIK